MIAAINKPANVSKPRVVFFFWLPTKFNKTAGKTNWCNPFHKNDRPNQYALSLIISEKGTRGLSIGKLYTG
jgi:hypothetical protein